MGKQVFDSLDDLQVEDIIPAEFDANLSEIDLGDELDIDNMDDLRGLDFGGEVFFD